MILAGEDNIREVIAFPKTQSGTDPMTNAPTPVDPKQLLDLGIRTLPEDLAARRTRRYSPASTPTSPKPQRVFDNSGPPAGASYQTVEKGLRSWIDFVGPSVTTGSSVVM